MQSLTYRASQPKLNQSTPATLDLSVDIHRPMRFPEGTIGPLQLMVIEQGKAKLASNTHITCGECQCGPKGLVVNQSAMFEMRHVDFDTAMRAMADFQDPTMPQIRTIAVDGRPIRDCEPDDDDVTW